MSRAFPQCAWISQQQQQHARPVSPPRPPCAVHLVVSNSGCRSSRRGEHQLSSRPFNPRASSVCFCRLWLGGERALPARSPQQKRNYQIQLINLSAMAILLRYLVLVRHDMMIQCRYGATFTKISCIMQCKTRKWVGVLFNVRRYSYLIWPLK